jgi:uroporphyrinogen decarboxylase
MGLEEFSYACADSPAQVERLMHVYVEYYRSLAQRYAACAEVRYVAVCDDLAFKGGLLFPPAWMRRAWLPIFEQIVKPLKAAGIKVIFHSDGNMEALIEDLIGIGVDAINPLEPLAGMDLAALKLRYGRDVTLIGGVDCSQLLPFGTPGQIRDEVRRLLDIGAPGGGFIIGDSSQVLPMTPVENVLAFYQTVHEYRG